MAVVTISRLLGSRGDEIALKVAESLGYELVDKALIVKVAERAGVSVEYAASFDEKFQSRTFEWLKGFISPRMGKILVDKGPHLDLETYVEFLKTVILGLAEKGNVVIVGRASQFILKDKDNAFHVRITADEKLRVEAVKARHEISAKEALEMIKKSDNMRKKITERYLKANWNDPMAYNLIISSSKLGIENTASIITDTIQKFSRTYEYIPGEKDRRKEKDRERRKSERRKGDRRTTEVGWTTKDLQTAILREGRPTRSFSKPDRRKGDRRKKARG